MSLESIRAQFGPFVNPGLNLPRKPQLESALATLQQRTEARHRHELAEYAAREPQAATENHPDYIRLKQQQATELEAHAKAQPQATAKPAEILAWEEAGTQFAVNHPKQLEARLTKLRSDVANWVAERKVIDARHRQELDELATQATSANHALGRLGELSAQLGRQAGEVTEGRKIAWQGIETRVADHFQRQQNQVATLTSREQERKGYIARLQELGLNSA